MQTHTSLACCAHSGHMGVPIPLGTWHHKDDALGAFLPLHKVKVWSQGKSYAWKHLGGALSRVKPPAMTPLGSSIGSPTPEGGTYHLEVPVELGVLPHVAQEAGCCPGGLLIV